MTQEQTRAHLTSKILMASRLHCPDMALLSFLSQLGELDDTQREGVLETARVAHDDVVQRTEMLYQGPFDQACYND
jgi:hypothetical protein